MVVCPKCKKEMTLLVKPRKRYYICCEEYTEEFMEMYMRVCRPTPLAPDGGESPLEDSPFETGVRRGAVVIPPAAGKA